METRSDEWKLITYSRRMSFSHRWNNDFITLVRPDEGYFDSCDEGWINYIMEFPRYKFVQFYDLDKFLEHINNLLAFKRIR